ncbi:hypothetical protein [Alistipes timonensis]
MKNLNIEQMADICAGRSAICTMDGHALAISAVLSIIPAVGFFMLGATIACAYHWDE